MNTRSGGYPKSLSLENFVGIFVGNYVEKWAVSEESFDKVSDKDSDKDQILTFSDSLSLLEAGKRLLKNSASHFANPGSAGILAGKCLVF